ncbi:MAG: GH92 family glycosyl hydrolase, partial [Bacteroidetes bacterium]|nr:GH92 family glycosyl hydrolase [Bacteroidota bacterium]
MRATRFFLTTSFVLTYFLLRAQEDLTKYVLPIAGSQSEYQLSNGNTYPCIGLPFAMNHWTPQTALNGERWQYSYNANYITGLKETHQPSPWVGDYGQLSLMPTTGGKKFLEKDRQSWFSHKTEIAAPGYYKVYLADHNVTAELTPSERGCIMQFTFPKTNQANVVIDAFDQGSFVKIIPEENTIVGYTTQHSGGKKLLPENFKNYFVIKFDKPFTSFLTWKDSSFAGQVKEVKAKRAGVVVTFSTANGEKIIARVASSFISPEQAELNLFREIGKKSFDEIKESGILKWNKYLSRFLIEDNKPDDLDNIRMFYTCLYRMLLYPREFFEYDADNKIIHYSPYNGEVLPGRMYTDNGFWDTFRAVHPFFTLFFPDVSKHILEGLANTYKESG